MHVHHKRDNNSTTFKTIKANILDLIKYQQTLAAMNGIQLTSWQALKEGIIATGKAMLANPTTWMVAGLTSIAVVAYKCSDAIKEVRNKAEELNNSFSTSKSEIDDYKSKINDLYKTINDSGASIEDVTTARQNLMIIQSELIEKFGDEKEAIDLITDSINGQSDALDILTQKQWQTTKNEFNKSGFWNDIANMSEGYSDNIDRMLNEYEGYKITIDLSKYGGRLFTEDYDEFKQTLIDDFGATISNVGTSYLDLTGNIDEVYQKILNIQNLLANNSSFKPDDSFNAYLGNLANDTNKLANQYEDFYKQYVLYEEIFKNSDYTDSYKQIVDAYSDYQDAFATGNEKSIKKAQDNFSNILTQATANISDDSVIDYFNSMYPDLQEVVGNWKFETTFTANTEDLKENVSKYLSDLGGLNSFDLKNFDYNVATEKQKKAYDELNSVAYTYGLTIEQLIDKLVNMGLVQDEEYQRLVDKFGKENIAKIAPEDLTFAYQIKNVGNMSFKEFQAEIQRLKDEASNPDETDILSFSEAWNDEDFSKAKDELLALAEAGKLTPETLQSTEEYKKLLEQTGMSAEEAAKKINSMTDASTQLQSMSAQISKMSDMLADKKNGTTASADDLASFDVEVRGLESWAEFERVMGSSKSTMEECQAAANDLATEWVSSNNFLSNLNDTNKDYYITQLKNMGIENAEAVVTGALTQKERELTAQTEFETLATQHNSDAKNTNNQVTTDLTNATVDEIAQIIAEGNATADTTAIMAEFAMSKLDVNNIRLDTSSDIEQIVAIANAAGASTTYVNALEEALKSLQNASQKKFSYTTKKSGTLGLQDKTNNFFSGANQDPSIQEIFDKAEENNINKDYDNAIKTANDIISSFKPLDASKYKVSSGGSNGYKGGSSKSGGSGSSKSDTKQTVDWIERKISSLNNNIDLTQSKLDNLFNIKTPKGLSKQITDVSNKLKKASVNTDKWKSKLSKIKIPDSAKKLIQDGKDVNLSKYSKTEQKNIKKYQSTWKSYSSAKKKENSLYNRKWDLETQKGKEALLKSQEKDYNTLAKIEEKAYKKYMSKAKSVKLSSSLKKKVQSGDYKISDYSSKTQSLIQEYQDWWDKAQDANKGKYEAKKNARDKRIERYQLYVDDAEAKIAKSQALTELKSGNYKEQNKQLEKQKKYLKESYDWQIKIAKENGKILEADKLRSEYQKELNDLTMQEFDNIANTYDNKVGLNNNKIKAFQDQISLLEAKGQKIGSALYTKQMSLNNINEKKLIAEREKLIEKLNEIPKGTDDWYKAQDTLFSVESELVNVQIENANLQKSINQLKFDRFDDLLSKLNDIVDETDFLIDMLDSENFFDDNGKITDDGITAMGMYAQKRDIYKSEAEKYKQMQAELDQMYANGDIGIIDYETKMREYKSGQMDMAKAAEDMNKSIINLVSDGLEKQNQALSESIQKQKDLLRAEKDLKSFQDSLNDANKNISRLERQYEILQGDDSEENRKRLREIKSQLEDAKKSRDDLLYDKSIEDQEKNLDDMYDAAVKSSEEYLKDSAKVLIDACGIVNTNTETVSKNIERISKETGVDINDNITKAWQNSGNAVSSFGDTITTKTPGIISQIKLITDEMDKLAEKSEKAAQAIVDAKTDDYLEHTTIGANGNNNGNGSSSETKKDNITTILENGSNKHPTSELAKAVQSAFGTGLTKGEMYQISSILKLGYKKEDFYDDSAIRNKAKNDVLQALIKKGYLKKSGNSYLRGFAKGGVISELSDAIRLNGDTVLVSAKPGERMLTEQQNGYWEKWTQSLPNLMNLTDIIKPNVNIPTAIPTVNREQSPVYNIDSSITVEGVATNEIVKDMANVAKKQAENVISEINRRTYAKGVRWK